ncbi:hypothetical protein GCK32_019667 [Trichostrongylus colubriformis]|uniref:Uncharacterized protein n=1 Tax=Trichostrongylus colubriformis TaxID=6319 RepID=A0AAN8EY79_TRICO
MLLVWFLIVLTTKCAAFYDTPSSSGHAMGLQTNRVANMSVSAATCRDSDLARFMNNAMASYIHDMGALSKSVLDQIVAYRKPGTWLVHAEIISGRVQGRDWQTTTNSDIFTGRSSYGCFYHDMQTYVLVLRLY